MPPQVTLVLVLALWGGAVAEQYNTSVAPPPGGALHIEPMMLGTSAPGNNAKNNNSSDVCALPREVGMCKAAFPRFFYDSETKTCRSFTYGGCGANANNFETLRECNQTCGGGGVTGADKGEAPKEKKSLRLAVLPPGEDEEDEEDEEEAHEAKEMSSDDFKELCVAPPVVGPCRAAFQRWFYNDTRGRCQKFIYGGCRGNKNNHESEEQCSSICAGVKLLPLKKQLPDMSDNFKAHCAAAPDTGPCRAAFSMFYFDPETQSCKRFLYGGCRGNDNRYDSEAECEERCANQGGAHEARGLGRSRWTSAFFLFLTLGGVSFLLLTALVVTMRCRRGNASRRTLSIRSDKEELLPDSERSSVDSLPLPESPNKA